MVLGALIAGCDCWLQVSVEATLPSDGQDLQGAPAWQRACTQLVHGDCAPGADLHAARPGAHEFAPPAKCRCEGPLRLATVERWKGGSAHARPKKGKESNHTRMHLTWKRLGLCNVAQMCCCCWRASW